MERYTRQTRLAEVGDAGQARLSAASHTVRGSDGALTELIYLHRAGLRAVSIEALATPRPFVHAAVFQHAASRAEGAGAWRALQTITAVLAQASA